MKKSLTPSLLEQLCVYKALTQSNKDDDDDGKNEEKRKNTEKVDGSVSIKCVEKDTTV